MAIAFSIIKMWNVEAHVEFLRARSDCDSDLIFSSVFTNGDILVPPARVLIPKHTLASWENILAMVTEKVHLRTGAVHRYVAMCYSDEH